MAVDQLGPVPRPHVVHVQADVEFLLHAPPHRGEVDVPVGLEVARPLFAGQVELHGGDVHRQVALGDQDPRPLQHLLAAHPHLFRLSAIVGVGQPHDRSRALGNGTGVVPRQRHDAPHLQALRRAHHHVLALVHGNVRGREMIDLRRVAEAHADHVAAHAALLSAAGRGAASISASSATWARTSIRSSSSVRRNSRRKAATSSGR